ncbi:MAG TPA: erythromycin esterase family protein [Armatimonadota bacterium]|nr:erythromycin esterase family protein [Armatimonadota bacterium]
MTITLPSREITDEMGAASQLRRWASPITGAAEDYDELLDQIGGARLVLLGEATHGTHEFYAARAAITRRLIEERGFNVVAVEADWPDAYRVNRFVRGSGTDTNANEALGSFTRFPTWMWRNRDVLQFVTWLREHNQRGGSQAGFYGLDLYSLHSSMQAVLGYLESVDPEAAARARYRYSCFDHFGEDPQAYGYAASFDLSESCENAVLAQLQEMRQRAWDYLHRDGRVAADEFFYAEQNARLVKDAEEYYRSMFRGRISSWNLRDRHMAEALEALVDYFDRNGPPAKVVVWEHNSHLGDARATDMGDQGEWNVGQLTRQRFGQEAALVGFTTYTGTVTAASRWDGPAERKRVRPALPESYEADFHELDLPAFSLNLHVAADLLRQTRLERAIGVIYLPQTERVSHYFGADLPDQFDAILHFDETRAVEPLDRSSGWDDQDLPETYPEGI